MTNDEIRSNDEARMTNGRERGPGLVPSAFVIRISDFFRHSIFVIRFFHAKPFQRRRPHSTTKQESAARNTVDRCHKGRVQLSVIGALRLGRFAAKRSSPEGSR